MILELQHRRPDGDIDTYHLKPGRRYHLGRGSGCEVRILDLKLSRKHAAIEFQDQAWTLIDLCSTNGCRLNGETMIGTAPLVTGSTIEIGQTALMIGQLTPPVAVQAAVSSEATEEAATAPALAVVNTPKPDANYPSDEFDPSRDKALSPLQPAPITPAPVERQPKSDTHRPAPAPVFDATEDRSSMVAKTPPAPIAPVVERRTSDRARDVIKPVTISPVLVAPLAITPVSIQPSSLQQSSLQPSEVELDATVSTLPMPVKSTPPPFVQPKVPTPLPTAPKVLPAAIPLAGAPAPGAGNVANSDERSYFITVLGRRIGPLSRAVARDLKARELKGTLRAADLDPYPHA